MSPRVQSLSVRLCKRPGFRAIQEYQPTRGMNIYTKFPSHAEFRLIPDTIQAFHYCGRKSDMSDVFGARVAVARLDAA